jgi:hypothetical protein
MALGRSGPGLRKGMLANPEATYPNEGVLRKLPNDASRRFWPAWPALPRHSLFSLKYRAAAGVAGQHKNSRRRAVLAMPLPGPNPHVSDSEPWIMKR